MAKADSTQKNVRLRNECWFMLEDLQGRWGCKRDAALEKLITAAHVGLSIMRILEPTRGYVIPAREDYVIPAGFQD